MVMNNQNNLHRLENKQSKLKEIVWIQNLMKTHLSYSAGLLDLLTDSNKLISDKIASNLPHDPIVNLPFTQKIYLTTFWRQNK